MLMVCFMLGHAVRQQGERQPIQFGGEGRGERHARVFFPAHRLTVRLIPWYFGTMVTVERVQTGVRMEKRVVKVLKAIAEFHDLSLGDLLEGIVLHAFEGKAPFGPDSMRRIAEIKKIYGLDLNASHAHKLVEGENRARKTGRSRKSSPVG